jgi:hypothetical protein
MALPDGSVKTTSQERLGEIKWNKGWFQQASGFSINFSGLVRSITGT